MYHPQGQSLDWSRSKEDFRRDATGQDETFGLSSIFDHIERDIVQTDNLRKKTQLKKYKAMTESGGGGLVGKCDNTIPYSTIMKKIYIIIM